MTTIKKKFDKLLREHDMFSYYYEEYVEHMGHYLKALLTNSQIGIMPDMYPEANISEEETEIIFPILRKFWSHYRNRANEDKKQMLEILEEHIPLSKVESIYGNSEIELLEWEFPQDKRPKYTTIKYKQKGGAYYSASLNNISYPD